MIAYARQHHVRDHRGDLLMGKDIEAAASPLLRSASTLVGLSWDLALAVTCVQRAVACTYSCSCTCS